MITLSNLTLQLGLEQSKKNDLSFSAYIKLLILSQEKDFFLKRRTIK